MLSRRSKNVVQVAANRTKLRIEGEQKGEKRLAASCHNLLLLSELRRLRQDLVNSISRLEGRCSIQLSYGRVNADSKTFAPRGHAIFDGLAICSDGRRSGPESRPSAEIARFLQPDWPANN